MTPYSKAPEGDAVNWLSKDKNEFKEVILLQFIKQVQKIVTTEGHFKKRENSKIFNTYLDFVQTIINRHLRWRQSKKFHFVISSIKTGKVEAKEESYRFNKFLQIRKKENSSTVKVRFHALGWQIEKWNKDMKKVEEVKFYSDDIDNSVVKKHIDLWLADSK